MTKAIVAVRVTPFCLHADGWSDHGARYGGYRLIVGSDGAFIDGKQVIRRDRRMKKNREAGHPWLTNDGKAWTGFHVEVETGGTR